MVRKEHKAQHDTYLPFLVYDMASEANKHFRFKTQRVDIQFDSVSKICNEFYILFESITYLRYPTGRFFSFFHVK